ncbi:anti-sigma factor [Gordonia soli]|uniref:anti-sigma factor n=1 Tax=Gordonia soli TaxID=320799 RepID=UPI000344F231|nr:anti-sigma factor [Gordonia soli]
MTDELDMIADVSVDARPPVGLSVAATADQLAIVRTVVERALFIDDWLIDDVADVKLGVDEICSQLIAASDDDSRLELTLTVGPRGVLGQINGHLHAGVDISTAGFGWRVVEAVTDAQSVTYIDAGDRRQATIRFAKLRR